MQSTPILRTLLACAALALPGAALAQDQAPEAAEEQTPPDVGLPPVEPGASVSGNAVVAETHRDWQILCGRLAGAEEDSCEMYQLLETDDGPIAEISIVALPESAGFPAGATITTPLETFLPTGVGFRVDSGQMRQEPFVVCTVIGCIARLGLDESEVTAMQRGASAFVTIASIVAVDQPIEVPVSLLGFTAALEDLQSRTTFD